MSESKTVDGSCLCGAVRFDVTLPTVFCAHCHCKMCQRNHGAAFVTWLAVERSQLDVTRGREDLVRYDSSERVGPRANRIRALLEMMVPRSSPAPTR